MDTRLASNTRSGHRLGWVLGLTSTAHFMVVLDSLVVVSALGTPAGFTAGFQPALWACVGFAALATLSCFALTALAPAGTASPEAPDVLVAA